MISMNNSQINWNQKIAMALASCLLLLLSFGPPLVPSQSTPIVNQARIQQQQQRHHYNIIPAVESANFISNPSDYLAMEPSEIKLVQDLLNSYSQDRQSSVELMQKQQTQQQQHGTPGHYEFEVAPKMEPPSAPRPPFKQANQMCPGSDPFGGFSPKDTLCGDLYQGKVPLNPMGQSVNEQAYPFELIKNKTLQFLAKSLPILKTEYETIPKVARYLPAHQLLNPTHAHSPLGQSHFQALNGDVGLSSSPSRGVPPPPPPLMNNANKRRRRKRNAGDSRQQQHAAIVVAEMLPNATLVVSSAHSAGRSASSGAARDLSHHQPTFAMITKDGYRPITGSALVTGNQHRPASELASSSGSSVRSAALSVSLDAADDDNNGDTRQQDEQNNGGGAQRSSHAAGNGQATHKANGSALNGLMAGKQEARVSARSTANSISNTNRNHGDETSTQVANGGDNAAKVAAPRTTTGEQAGSGAALAQRTPTQQQKSSSALGSRCANVNGLLLYTVCQAASALIEPPVESQPATPTWLQAAKQIGSLYSAASSTDSYAPGASNPLWTLWSAFSGSGAQSAQELSSAASNNELSYKSAQSAASQGKSQLSASSSVLGMINLLNPLMSFFAPSLQRTASDNSIATNKNNADKLTNKQQPASFAAGLKTVSNLLLTGLSLAGLYDWLGSSSSASPYASQNPWAGSLLSALAPTSTSFARRKKPFDPNEQFVDTPASLAALASGKALAPGVTSGQPTAKQPPTPCPSVEEYISPTFARNYQGAWKYVVQIPHEGYFTQTIQRSSCVRQKCEFTEGVCHEAPRWVSLLVAEIYYPNAIFGSTTAATTPSQPPQDQLSQRVSNNAQFIDSNQQQQLLNQLMQTAPSTNSIQHQAKSLTSPTSGQDPMQMTDSLSTYNHNLNSAFLTAANELGLDPTNMAHMQQLANAHNYQLMQRQGQLAQAAEAYGQQVQQVQQLQQPQQQQQQQQFAPKMQQQPQYQMESAQPQQQQVNNDYIRALAVETIRQNPHLSIDELIKSLQLSQARRKKRDVQQQPMMRQPMMQSNAMPQQQQQHRIQNRASNDNEPNGNHAPQQQQQQQQPLEFAGLSSPSAIMAQHEHSAAGQQQPMMHELPPIPQAANSIQNSPSASSPQPPTGSTASPGTAAQENQIECDGHDKIGCYVVRVYYDWFLVNGSCKCWKTDLARGVSPSSSSSSSGTGSFIRRIFTG